MFQYDVFLFLPPALPTTVDDDSLTFSTPDLVRYPKQFYLQKPLELSFPKTPHHLTPPRRPSPLTCVGSSVQKIVKTVLPVLSSRYLDLPM